MNAGWLLKSGDNQCLKMKDDLFRCLASLPSFVIRMDEALETIHLNEAENEYEMRRISRPPTSTNGSC